MILGADPGGEYYFSLSLASAITAGVWNENNGWSLSNAAPTGRAAASDGKIYAFSSSGAAQFIGKYLASNYGHLIAGYALYTTNSAWVAGQIMLAFTNGAAITSSQCDVRVADTNGHLEITRNGTVLGSASTQALTPGWHRIELDTTFATSASGTADLWVDGVRWVHATGVQTATTVATANRVYFSGAIMSQQSYAKDFYWLDPSTGVNTTPLGDIQVLVAYPSGAGTNQQWSNTGGASQTASVQDGRSHGGTWPDGDTSYISDSTGADVSDFAHDAISANSIFAVVHASYVRSDAGSASFQQVAISAGTIERSPIAVTGGTYGYFYDVLETDPNTSAPWTVSNFNSATFGIAIPAHLDEDFWQNPIAPLVASIYQRLPLGDPDEILA